MTTWTFTARTTPARGARAPGSQRRWPSTWWERLLSRAAWRPEGPSRGGSVTPPTLRLDRCASLKRSKGSLPSRWGLSFCQVATTTTAVSRGCVCFCVCVGGGHYLAGVFRDSIGSQSNTFGADTFNKICQTSKWISWFSGLIRKYLLLALDSFWYLD